MYLLNCVRAITSLIELHSIIMNRVGNLETSGLLVLFSRHLAHFTFHNSSSRETCHAVNENVDAKFGVVFIQTKKIAN